MFIFTAVGMALPLPQASELPYRLPVPYRLLGKSNLTGYWLLPLTGVLPVTRPWIQDPASRVQDPGCRILDPGSGIIDSWSGSYRLPGILVLTAYQRLTACRKAYRSDAPYRLPKR